jgi:hypothetical protein
MRKALLLLAATLLITLPVGPAHAVAQADPNDSDGQLDVRAIGGTYNDSTGTLTIKTREGWGCKFLRRGIMTSLKWYFDDKDDGDTDLIGTFVCTTPNKNPTLVFNLHGPDSGNHYESLPTKRANRRTVRVTFPRDLTEIDSKHLSMWAKSKDGISSGCDDECPDRAPDEGAMSLY